MDLFKPLVILPFQREWKGPVMGRAGQLEVGASLTCLDPRVPELCYHPTLVQVMRRLETAGQADIYGSWPKPLCYRLYLSWALGVISVND